MNISRTHRTEKPVLFALLLVRFDLGQFDRTIELGVDPTPGVPGLLRMEFGEQGFIGGEVGIPLTLDDILLSLLQPPLRIHRGSLACSYPPSKTEPQSSIFYVQPLLLPLL